MTSDGVDVVIADSHEIVREGISSRLRRSCDVKSVVEAEDGYSAIKACRQNKPDILLLDYSISRPDGREVLLKVHQTCPDTRIVVISSTVTVTNAFFALTNGAVGYMPKQAGGMDFVNAINAALRGFTYLPVQFLSEFVESRRHLIRTGNIFGLSPREIEILDACIAGQSTKEVASNLNISARTVETHRNNIYRKTSCRNLRDLASLVQ